MSCSYGEPPKYTTPGACPGSDPEYCKPGYKEVSVYQKRPSNCFFGGYEWVRDCVKDSWPEENKLACAFGELTDTTNCNPRWCKENPEGEKTILSYCVGENLKNDQRCVNYCSQNPGKCQINMINYCGALDNMGGDFCKNWAFNNVGIADNVVSNYCARHPEDKEMCGCFNIPAEITALTKNGLGIKPQCNVSQCINPKAYKTKNLTEDKTCPVLNICEQTLNINGNVKGALSGINFSCDQKSSNQASAPKVIYPVGKKSVSLNKNIIIISVSILIVLILSMSSLLLLSSSSR